MPDLSPGICGLWPLAPGLWPLVSGLSCSAGMLYLFYLSSPVCLIAAMTWKSTPQVLGIDIANVLIHCFTGSKQFAHKLLDLGSYISASGIVTFKKSKELADTFKSIPDTNILIETDAPYLSPEPLRGKSNEPSHIIHTSKFLANLKNINYADFSKRTTNNFFNLFGKLG